VRDPSEGLTETGLIRTGASHARIPDRFSNLLSASASRVRADAPTASVYVYGSVATGDARSPESDVDLLTIGLPADGAATISERLSADFSHLCRGVEIAAGMAEDFEGAGDEAYGGRVFLHHYCVHLAGPDIDRATSAFRGDQRAARGFNGDIAQHAARWQHDFDNTDAPRLGRTLARKTLLAVAGLVSVHDATWTTDRKHASRRWGQIHPELADGLAELLEWSALRSTATTVRLAHHLANTIDQIVCQFTADIGLWPT
jgi:predicted nucleotidyltransferase